ncbi:hypothetical protein ACFY64_32150 [Streptomyces collinus]|uniref:hypothetical protein n=1 Tax=Streptomyces collinus TaxID=42684 RepID=UPI0036A61116
MTTDADLETLLAQLPQPSPRAALGEFDAARSAARAQPTRRTIIPEPVLPPMWPHPDSGIVRFRCPVAPGVCLWAYEHNSYEDDTDPISVPLRASAEEIGRFIGERAERRSAALRERVEGAIRSHCSEAHPGLDIPERPVW